MYSNEKGKKRLLYTLGETSGIFRLNAAANLDVSQIILLEQRELDRQMNDVRYIKTPNEFQRSGYGDVYAFFQEASKDYDSDLINPYWAFTHDILKFILTKFITEHFKTARSIRVFDAGAGTGNWSQFVMSLSVNMSCIMFDMNANMLTIAKPKLSRLHTNIRAVEGNLEIPSDFPSQRSNLVLCMHNVIGLARNTGLVLRNLFAYLEPGGLAFIMAMNKYHAFNFASQFRESTEVQRVVQDGTIKFKDDMPEMFCYTPAEFEKSLRDAGFSDVTVLGFPVTVYPSMQDTKLLRKDSSTPQLSDPKIRSALLDLERRLCLNPYLAYRAGSSLISVCKKNADD